MLIDLILFSVTLSCLFLTSFPSFYVRIFAIIWSLSNHPDLSEVKRQKSEHVSLSMCAFCICVLAKIFREYAEIYTQDLVVYTYFVSVNMYLLIVHVCLSFEMIGLEKVYFILKEIEGTAFLKGKLKTWLTLSNRMAWTSPKSREFNQKKGRFLFSLKTLQKPTCSKILCQLVIFP